MNKPIRWLPVRGRFCSLCRRRGPGLLHRDTRAVVCLECLAEAFKITERQQAKLN